MTNEAVTDRISADQGEDLLSKFRQTHETIDRPEKFAVMFCDVAQSQNAVREKLVEILRTSVQHDVESRKEIKKVLKEIYDEDWKKFVRSAWGKIALVIWTLVSAMIGIVVNNYFQ